MQINASTRADLLRGGMICFGRSWSKDLCRSDTLTFGALERIPIRLNTECALTSFSGRIFCGKPVSTFPEDALGNMKVAEGGLQEHRSDRGRYVDVSSNRAILVPDAQADLDPVETREWIDALNAVTEFSGSVRAEFLLHRLEDVARRSGAFKAVQPYSSYRNTIPAADQGAYPGDLAIEERVTSIIRWNALAMVVRANKAYGELGGHVASYASAAEILKPNSTISFARAAAISAATSSIFNRIRRPASMPALSRRPAERRASGEF